MGLKEVDGAQQGRDKVHIWGRKTINLGRDARNPAQARREDRKVADMTDEQRRMWRKQHDDDPLQTGVRCISEPALFRCGKSFQSSPSSVALSVSTVTNASHDDNN